MILGILQARVSSSRLPGKVMKPILGQPMILRQIERLRRATTLDRLVIATSVDPSDDPLAALLHGQGVEVVRGPLDDVLARFVVAAARHDPEWIVRLTGDCPLADPAVIDRIVRETVAAGADYGSNTLVPTYPDGLDVEVMRGAVLRQVAAEARTAAEREHVTLAIHRHPERFRLHDVRNGTDLSALRWTVDEPADFALVERIYEALYPYNPAFATDDILRLLAERPDLATVNTAIRRNEGLARSLAGESAGNGGTPPKES
ncbi:MAG: cytidylyltransferase domain-containing protein [Gemmatimonas sp.]